MLCTECLRLLDRGPYVKHARILSVLMMVHGGLVAAAGLSYVLFGGFILDELADIPADPSDPTSGMLPELTVGVFALIALVQIGPGVLQALAGWRLFHLNGVVMAWAGALVGLVGCLGCYCAPTSLAIASYAIFVLTRDDVRARIAVGVPPASPAS